MSFFSPDPPVTYRPLSLSVIGWFYGSGGALGLLFFWVPLVIPSVVEVWSTAGVDPVSMLIMGGVSNTVHLISGFAILKRRHWGRVLVLVSLPVLTLLVAFVNPGFLGFAIGSNAVNFAILAFFLTRQAANGYFDGTTIGVPQELVRVRRLRRGERTQSDIARVFGILLALPAWWILTTIVAIAISTSGIVGIDIWSSRGFPSFVLIAAGVGAALLVIGMLLWGRRRWKGYIGWGLLALGTLALSMAPMGFFPFDLSQFLPPDGLENFDPEEFAEMMRKAGRYAAIAAAVLLSTGGLLVFAQRKHDYAAAAFMYDESPPSE